MEEAKKRCANRRMIYSELLELDGYMHSPTTSIFRLRDTTSHWFIEMIYDLINNNIPIETKNFTIFIGDAVVDTNFSNVYEDGNKRHLCLLETSKISINDILGDDLCKYLQDECDRHKILVELKKTKEKLKEFLGRQTSFDDVQELNKILEVLPD